MVASIKGELRPEQQLAANSFTGRFLPKTVRC
jgi:hypothetical protein